MLWAWFGTKNKGARIMADFKPVTHETSVQPQKPETASSAHTLSNATLDDMHNCKSGQSTADSYLPGVQLFSDSSSSKKDPIASFDPEYFGGFYHGEAH